MEAQYPVIYGKEQIGKVSVRQSGLYYYFHCRCQVTGGAVLRLRVCCGDRQENLGVLVPEDGGFGLDTKLPAKRLGEGEMSFLLVPKYEKTAVILTPVYPEEPFAYISRLRDAYLVRRDGQIGIAIK